MTRHFLAQKGAVHIVAILVVLAVFGAIIWFFIKGRNTPPSFEEIASLKQKPFEDVSVNDKNYTAISYLAREGVLEGDKDGKFNSKDVLTRAGWTVILVRLTGITPDEGTYKNCFSDVGLGKDAASICLAKEQGWLEGLTAVDPQTFNFQQLIVAVYAQESKENFNPDVPVKITEAVGSLSRLMKWEGTEGAKSSNETAVGVAKEREISQGNDIAGNLTKGEAAGIIYRSVATIPLGKEKFSPELEHQVERYRVENLIDLDDKLGSQRQAENERIRKARQKNMAKIIGDEAAAEIMATTKDGSEEESSAYIRKAREKNYEKLLAEDKVRWGEPPSFNVLEALQKVFAEKGIVISKDDLLISKSTPPHYEDIVKINDNPAMNTRESVEILLLLDKNYGVLPRNNLAKVKYLMKIGISTFYLEGRSVGRLNLILRNWESGVGEKAGSSLGWRNLNKLEAIFKEGLADLEANIGQMITPSTLASPSPVSLPTKRSTGAPEANEYSDGYFEFLDVATGQPSIAFSSAQKPHIIVATDPGKDVRVWLPIRIEIKKDGNNFWSGKIEGDPSQVCRGPTGCSTNGPSGIELDWKKIEIIAYDKNNRVVATFGETYDPR
ncbi:S-layer homology domain-containing protein [Candidatus Daviesbacteria bacterium]|nr:S-layer homology domain-containing protein [Candidatus Daviesbacteria bacterium]